MPLCSQAVKGVVASLFIVILSDTGVTSFPQETQKDTDSFPRRRSTGTEVSVQMIKYCLVTFFYYLK